MKKLSKIDPATTIIPLVIILILCAFFMIDPEGSTAGLSSIRNFLGDDLGVYYLIVGLGVLLVSLYIAFSKYGKIVLGKPGEKPQYSFFNWLYWLECVVGSVLLTLVLIFPIESIRK